MLDAGLPDSLDKRESDRERFQFVAEWVFHMLPTDDSEGRMRDYGAGNYSLRVMLADAEKGGSFQCDDRATILARAMLVLGYQSRQVPLRRADGEGHMLAEAWLEDEETWMAYEPLAEQYYLVNGVPASALTLLRMTRAARSSQVEVSSGPPFRETAPYFHFPRVAKMPEDHAPNFRPAHYTRIETENHEILIFQDGDWYVWPNLP